MSYSNGNGEYSPPASASGQSTPPLLEHEQGQLYLGPGATAANPNPSPGTQRTAAVSLLRRAASNREAPSSRLGSPSPTPTPTPPTSATGSASPFPFPPHLRHPSGHRHTTSDDSTLALSPGSATPGASLERTASLLARSIAMAKLTGEALPTPPRGYFSPPSSAPSSSQPLPTLGDLRERVKLKRAHTVTGVGGSRVTPAPLDSEAEVEQNGSDGTVERTAARVNLMRKLSSRRLESPAAKDSLEVRDREREQSRLDVVGRRGKARPRSGSVGDWRPTPPEWSQQQQHLRPTPDAGSPLAISFAPVTSLSEHHELDFARSTTPFSIRSSGAWTAERDRQSVLARMTGETAWEFDDRLESQSHVGRSESNDAREVIRVDSDHEHEYDTSGATTTPRPEHGDGSGSWSADGTPQIRVPRHDSSGFGFLIDSPRRRDSPASASASPPESPTVAAAADGLGVDFGAPRPGANSVRRGSIPHYMLQSFPDARRGGPASFGIGAVEESDSDDVRRRGSSASSSVALHDRKPDSFTSDGPRPARMHEQHSDNVILTLADRSDELEEVASPVLAESAPDDVEWTLKERRLVEKVERKREAGLARSKEGAFPPPEDGYKFPSPTLSQQSPNLDDPARALSPEQRATSPLQESLAMFDRPKSPPTSSAQWATKSSRSSSSTVAAKRTDSNLFSSAYMPLSIPEALGGGPVVAAEHPLSPLSTFPPAPPLLAESTPLERSTSGDSKQSRKRWFGANLFHGNGSDSATTATGSAATVATASPPASLSSEMTRQGSGRSLRSTVLAKSTSRDSAPDSTYSSSTEMHRDLSSSSTESLFEPVRRVERLPVDQLPASRILAKLDSILGTDALDSTAPSVLDHPPRQLLLHTPVLQIVNAHTVKDRHLFLFSDLLLIAKPILDDHPLTGQPLPSTLDSSFIVKSIVELRDLKVQSIDEPPDEPRSKARPKAMLAFIDRFANDPVRAISQLVTKGSISNDAPTIANLLFRNPDLNRNQVGAYLAATRNKHILKAYVDKFRLAGVRIDDALRCFLMTMRLPHDLAAAEHVLGVFSLAWAETNGAAGLDPSLTTSLVLAIMRLSDALHSQFDNSSETGLFSLPDPDTSVDDFVASFREHDPRLLVPEVLLTIIFSSLRRQRIEQASDNSMFTMTPDIEATTEPSRINGRLTYRVPSEAITITIPEPDPKFHIKLHGNDLKFDPPYLTFAKSATQTFRVTGTALGVRAMVLIKLGANAPRYQGLPLNKVFSIERAFMQHTFQISFVNHLNVKRKYMLSTLDADVRAEWLQAIRERTHACLTAPPPATRALEAGSAVAVQVLREALIAPESPLPASATASPRPNTAAARFGPQVPSTPRLGRLGTPTRPGAGALVRSNSFSRTYATGIGKVEADLVAERDRRPSAAPTRRGSRDDSQASPFVKSGKDIQVVTEQNSLLPLVLSFLSVGASAAPHPLSSQGSAFSLPPLPSVPPTV